ncbi:hypothetical protein G5C51_31685 [Streptomyces sp. A7024]|uniref:DUF2399 domain-containing protein n=1 Tax=Streptomyces coryli TaxID=1128680 RepID=A0A6G4U9T2_9ACTN|nr:hypothetical protein [Streptomyces coryli]NGN68446.1 hypothetical protein [Streptomyces coryli]
MDTAGRNTVSGRLYTRTRVRGFAPWAPKPATLRLVEQIRQILAEYEAYLPMTARQVFYRLVGAHGYPKDERAYDRLTETLNRARRARLIPMEAIRDDRAASMGGDAGYAGPEAFWESMTAAADNYRRPLTEGQPRAVEMWIEAAGMMPMLADITKEFGVTVYCSGGFESVAAKHDAAHRIARRHVATTVLSIGDLDPSGLSILDAAAADVTAFVTELGGKPPTVVRLAVTPKQVARYRLQTAPQKRTDHRGAHMPATVQAEALSPDQLTGIARAALADVVDTDTIAAVRRRSELEREQLLAALRTMRGSGA